MELFLISLVFWLWSFGICIIILCQKDAVGSLKTLNFVEWLAILLWPISIPVLLIVRFLN